MLTGQNGILNRAGAAKTKTETSQVEEELRLAITSLATDYYTGTEGGTFGDYIFSHEEELKRALGTTSATLDATARTITYKGKLYTVADDGTIELQRQIDSKYIPTITSKITTDAEGNNVAGTEVESGTSLYIALTINLQEGTVDKVTSTEKLDSVGTSGKYIYKVTKNGTYKFSITTNAEKDNEYTTTNTVEVSKFIIANVPENWTDATKESWGYSYKDMSSSSQTEVAVNEPSLTSEMTPIKYVAGSTTGLEEGSKWANAMTPDGSMWVWIPRYAYKITRGEHGDGLTYTSYVTTEAGTIDVIFLKGKTNKDFNGNDIPDGYTVHPTFTIDANAGGGWSQELEGIWMAKFESSGSTSALAVKPNVQSLRSLSIGNMYTAARNAAYETTQTTNSLHSHMMKNSEWGATAYLAHSKYGRNGTEISINNSSDFYTGRSAGAPGSSSTSYSSAGTYEYNTTGGVLASTTGNVYGIYDMSGGALEYVASYVNNGNSSLGNGSSFAKTGTSSEYVTVYSKGTPDLSNKNYNVNSGMRGDAVYETSKYSEYSSYEEGWFNDGTLFPYSSTPFFIRGGWFGAKEIAGIFCFLNVYSEGNGSGSAGFRPVLAVF